MQTVSKRGGERLFWMFSSSGGDASCFWSKRKRKLRGQLYGAIIRYGIVIGASQRETRRPWGER